MAKSVGLSKLSTEANDQNSFNVAEEIDCSPSSEDTANRRRRLRKSNRATKKVKTKRTRAGQSGSKQSIESNSETSPADENLSNKAKSSRANAATELLELVEERISQKIVTIFVTPAGDPFATFPRRAPLGRYSETCPIRSQAFKAYLRELYRDHTDSVCGSDAIKAVIEYLGGMHLEVQAVNVRIAHHENKIFIDLCDATRSVVEISAGTWKVIGSADCPVRFFRPHGMESLPVPDAAEPSWDPLRRLMNIKDANDFLRVQFYLISTFVEGAQLVLLIVGEQGTAKSTQARILRDLLDPNDGDVQSPPEKEADLFLACRNQWVIALDNVSHISAQRSDAMCRISTGASYRVRKLYEDTEEVIYKFRRPQIITAIQDVITRRDLCERKLKLQLEPIPKSNRRTEKAVYAELQRVRPQVLGALYSAVSRALAELPNIGTRELPRMADVAEFLLAAERHLGWPSGIVEAIFEDEAQSDAEELRENDPFVSSLLSAVESRNGGWVEKGNRVVEQLRAAVVASGASAADFIRLRIPESPKALGSRLRELAPELRRLGLEYEKPKGGARNWTFALRQPGTSAQQLSLKVP